MKWVIRGVIALVVVIIIALVVVGLAIDSIAKTAVEKGASFALGVTTTLDKADVGIFSGQFKMDTLNVANPEGFETDHFVNLDNGEVAVSLGSLMSDTVEVPRLALTGLDMNLEKKDGKENAKVILENLQKLSSGEKKQDTPEEGAGKKYVIREIDIGEITVHLKGYPMAKTVKVAPIKLTNVGSAGEPIDMAYLTGIIMRSVFQSLLQGGIELPSDLTGLLSSGIGQLGGLGEVGMETLGKAQEIVGETGKKIGEEAGKIGEKIGGEAGEKVGEVGKKAEEGLNKVGEGIGNILGGKKKDEEKKE